MKPNELEFTSEAARFVVPIILPVRDGCAYLVDPPYKIDSKEEPQGVGNAWSVPTILPFNRKNKDSSATPKVKKQRKYIQLCLTFGQY